MPKIPSFHLNVDLADLNTQYSDLKSLTCKNSSNFTAREKHLFGSVDSREKNVSLFVALTKTVQIRREDTAEENGSSYLAVFIPPALASQIKEIMQGEDLSSFCDFMRLRIDKNKELVTENKCAEQENDFESRSFQYGISNEKLQKHLQQITIQIHPALINLEIRGVFISDRSIPESTGRRTPRSASTDIILFQIPHHTDRRTSKELNEDWKQMASDIIYELDGEPLANEKNNVLKIFRVTKIDIGGQITTTSPDAFKYSITFVNKSYSLIFNREHDLDSKSHQNLTKKKTHGIEIPSCPVCQHRIDPVCLGFPPPKTHQLCSYTCLFPDSQSQSINQKECENISCRNRNLLTPWPFPSYCVACHIIENHQSNQILSSKTSSTISTGSEIYSRSTLATNLPFETSCYECGMTETLWVCLICGFIGCGRYSQFHAGKHYHESGHSFSLELATQRIWDYAADSFVQRIDFLTCPAINGNNTMTPSTSIGKHESSQSSLPHPMSLTADSTTSKVNGIHGRHSDTAHSSQFRYNPPKKTIMISEEYEALIQSALEDQAQHFEGEISRLRAELTAQHLDEEKISEKESQEIGELQKSIQNLRSDVNCLGRELLEGQAEEAMLRATSQRLLREQADSQEVLNKVKGEASREHEEGKSQVEELEQQIRDLTANLRMMQQFAQNEELCNAQIFGTTSKASKRGKKVRRSRR